MKYIVIILFLFPVAGCAPYKYNDEKEEVRGKFFASFLVKESAHFGPIKKKEGFVFYIEEPEQKNTIGPFLNGYRYKDGKLVETFDQGSTGADFVQKIQELKLTSFSYTVEKEKALKRAHEKNELVILGSRDGALWEVIVAADDGEIIFTQWNPQGEIETLSPYSENLFKLKILIEILAYYYGSYHFQL